MHLPFHYVHHAAAAAVLLPFLFCRAHVSLLTSTVGSGVIYVKLKLTELELNLKTLEVQSCRIAILVAKNYTHAPCPLLY